MDDALVLAVETSARRGTAALASGPTIIAEVEIGADKTYTSAILPAIRDLLARSGRRVADVSVFAFSHGPGSFTGLRVAATIGRMLAASIRCRVVAVPTLDLIAESACRAAPDVSRIAVIVDARRGQVFGAWYERGGATAICRDAAAIRDPRQWLAALPRPISVAGEAGARCAELIAELQLSALDPAACRPCAAAVAQIGRRLAESGAACRPEEIIPLYLRPPECEEVYDSRRAAAIARRASAGA